jgi:toxin ParE1/3/4
VKRVVPRAAAERDIDEAADYYALHAGEDVARRFVEALSAAYRAIGERPRSGSPRFSLDLKLPDLRPRRLGRFPYFVYDIERADHIDVWRILHAQRDVSMPLRESED